MGIKFTDNDLINAVSMGVGAAHAEHTPAGKRIRNAIDSAKWNPLENTDHALDVAAVHKMKIVIVEGSICVSFLDHSVVDDTSKDLPAALRRSIVLAAAGCGERQA